MFKKSFVSLAEGFDIENVASDYKKAKNIGRYKISENAIYKGDYTYLPFSAIDSVVCDKGSVHVTGCCIGCLPVDRIVARVGEKPFIFAFDSKKAAEKAALLMCNKNQILN